MSQAEAAMRRAGALVALAAASALVLFPAVEGSRHGVLALFAIFLLGCATVLLSPARRAVAELVRRAAREIIGAPARAATELLWVGFTCIVFIYAVYVAGDVRVEAEEVSVKKVNGLILFLVFLMGVWTVSLSMLTASDPPPLPVPPVAEAKAEEELDGGEVNGTVPPGSSTT